MNDCSIEFDGGVLGNVGIHHPLFSKSVGAWGWVALGNARMHIREDSGVITPATSMMAELYGALQALTWARSARYEHVTLRGDSRFVINWLNGENRTSQIPHLATLQRQIAELVSCEVVSRPGNRRAICLTKEPGKLIVTARHIPRSKNRYADALCRRVLTSCLGFGHDEG